MSKFFLSLFIQINEIYYLFQKVRFKIPFTNILSYILKHKIRILSLMSCWIMGLASCLVVSLKLVIHIVNGRKTSILNLIGDAWVSLFDMSNHWFTWNLDDIESCHIHKLKIMSFQLFIFHYLIFFFIFYFIILSVYLIFE